MARLRDDSSHAKLQGAFGDMIFKWYGDKCVVQRRPRKAKRRRTARLAAAHQNSRQGLAYAQAVLADPAARAYYADAARTLRRRVYDLARSDAMKAPTVAFLRLREDYKGRAGGVLLLATGDLFRVRTLRITFRDPAGDIVETGEATRRKKDFLYRLKREHPSGQILTLDAVAESRAGHRIVLTERVGPLPLS